MFGLNNERLAVFVLVTHVHGRVDLYGLDHGVAEDVRKGDLAAAGALEVIIDEGAVFPHELDRHITHGRGRGDGQRLIHVLGDGLEHALELGLARLRCLANALERGLRLLRSRLLGSRLIRYRCSLLRGSLSVCSGGRRAGLARGLLGFDGRTLGLLHGSRRLRCALRGVVGLKILAPLLVDGVRVLGILLELFVNQPCVGAEDARVAHGRCSPHFLAYMHI